jgi:hypothetical protein
MTSKSNLPAWLATELLNRGETITTTRTLDEHTAHIAAEQAAKGLVWDADSNSWIKA